MTQTEKEQTRLEKMAWGKSLEFMVENLFGEDFCLAWAEIQDCQSLQPVADNEEDFKIELPEWMKKLFLITEQANAKLSEINQALNLIPFPPGPQDDILRKASQIQKLGNAFRQLFFAIIFKMHPDCMGPWGVGIRTGWKVVRAPLKTMPIQPQIITDPGQIQNQMKKPKGEMNN